MHNLVNDLKRLGIWENVRGKIIESQGDIADLEEIPQELRDVFDLMPTATVDDWSRIPDAPPPEADWLAEARATALAERLALQLRLDEAARGPLPPAQGGAGPPIIPKRGPSSTGQRCHQS